MVSSAVAVPAVPPAHPLPPSASVPAVCLPIDRLLHLPLASRRLQAPLVRRDLRGHTRCCGGH